MGLKNYINQDEEGKNVCEDEKYIVDNETYTPMSPNEYYYTAIQNLDENIDYYLKENNKIKINIFAYEIDNHHKYPFLKFLLWKNPLDNILKISELPRNNNEVFNSTEDIIASASFLLFKLLSEIYIYDIDDYVNQIDFNGFHINGNEVSLFYNLTKCELIHLDLLGKSNFVWFGLIDEIVNQQHICNFKICESVTNFFTQNSSFCFLYNKEGEKYVTPNMAYVGKHDKFLHFNYVFGVIKTTEGTDKGIVGPSYYLTDYNNAIKEGGWSLNGKPEYSYGKLLTINEYGKYNKGGIVRFALFTENTKVIQNLHTDPPDESELKQQKLNYENGQNSQNGQNGNNYEHLTLRITDYDGKWMEYYDSVYISKLILTSYEVLENTPIIVVKNHDQQVPLTYHYIDNKQLGETYDKNKDYFIS